MLGVFLTNQALKIPLALLIFFLFLLENIHQFVKNSASFQFFFLLASLWSSLLHVGCHCWQYNHPSCYSSPKFSNLFVFSCASDPELRMVQYFSTPDFTFCCPAETGSHYFECWSASYPHMQRAASITFLMCCSALQFTSASGAMLWCAAGRGHLLSPGPLPSFLAEPAHPTFCLATAQTPFCLFPPTQAWKTSHSCVWAHCQTEL